MRSVLYNFIGFMFVLISSLHFVFNNGDSVLWLSTALVSFVCFAYSVIRYRENRK